VRESTLSDLRYVDNLISSDYSGFSSLKSVSDILYFQGNYPHLSLVVEEGRFIGYILAIKADEKKPLLLRKTRGNYFEVKCFLMHPKYWNELYLTELMEWFFEKLKSYFAGGIAARVELSRVEAIEFFFKYGMKVHEVSYFKPVEKSYEIYFKPAKVDLRRIEEYYSLALSDYKFSQKDLEKHIVFLVDQENEGKCLAIAKKENSLGRVVYLAVSKEAYNSNILSKLFDSIAGELYHIGVHTLIVDCLVEKREIRRHLEELGFRPLSYFLYMPLRD